MGVLLKVCCDGLVWHLLLNYTYIVMNKHTEYKLLQYAALASTAMFGEKISAQVVYTDIEPDVMLFESMWDYNEEHYFDLNLDGIIDVGLYYTAFYNCGYCPYQFFFDVDLFNGAEIATMIAPPLSLWSTYQSTWSSSFGECQIPSHAVADGMAEGEFINSANQFGVINEVFQTFQCGSNGDFGVQIDVDFWDHEWSPDAKPFLGFKIPVALGYQYAWLRLYSGDDDKVWVTEMAYQALPNAGLILEIPTTSIESNSDDAPVIFSSNNTLHINYASNFQLHVVNIQGALVFDALINTNNYTQHLDLPTGIYVAEVSDGRTRISKTMVIGGM
jgi:hypothetical protein